MNVRYIKYLRIFLRSNRWRTFYSCDLRRDLILSILLLDWEIIAEPNGRGTESRCNLDKFRFSLSRVVRKKQEESRANPKLDEGRVSASITELLALCKTLIRAASVRIEFPRIEMPFLGPGFFFGTRSIRSGNVRNGDAAPSREIGYSRRRASIAPLCFATCIFKSTERRRDARVGDATGWRRAGVTMHLMRALLIGARACIPPIPQIRAGPCISAVQPPRARHITGRPPKAVCTPCRRRGERNNRPDLEYLPLICYPPAKECTSIIIYSRARR